MPALALPAFWAAIGGTATAAATIYGDKKKTSAAQQAAQLETDAANHAADAKSQSDAATLAFEKEQAARDQANFEATQHANYDQWAASQQMSYDQWAARQRRLGTLGEIAGVGGREIPSFALPPYVATTGGSATPTVTGGTPRSTPMTSPYAPSSAPTVPTAAAPGTLGAIAASPYALAPAQTGVLTPQPYRRRVAYSLGDLLS